MDAAVAEVAFRLAMANTALCPRNGPQTGLLLTSVGEYGRALRDAAAVSLDPRGRPTIEVVVPHSPADAAGLRAGDVLLSIGDESTAADAGKPATPEESYRDVQAVEDRLTRALTAGPVPLKVERDGEPIELMLTARAGCDVRAEVKPSHTLDATADARSMTITTALMAELRSPDELATLMGHEMAHTILRSRRLAAGKAERRGGGWATSRDEERAADELGLYLMARAGYDPQASVAFWDRFGKEHPLVGHLTVTHPDAAKRAAYLADLSQKIRQARDAGILPNP